MLQAQRSARVAVKVQAAVSRRRRPVAAASPIRRRRRAILRVRA